jgi:polysaccharide biosynthesis transport protein
MDLLYLFHSLMRKKWIIIFATAVGLAAGVAFAMTIKKTYTSLAQYSTGFTMGQKVPVQERDRDLPFPNRCGHGGLQPAAA